MVFYIKREGNSLQGQWLGLRTFTAKGPNSIASLKTKTQKQSSMDRKKKKKKKEIRRHKTSRMHGYKGTGGHENTPACESREEISGDTTLSTP